MGRCVKLIPDGAGASKEARIYVAARRSSRCPWTGPGPWKHGAVAHPEMVRLRFCGAVSNGEKPPGLSWGRFTRLSIYFSQCLFLWEA